MANTNPSIKLLIVDDDDDMRDDLMQLFRKQGHEVTAAVSGEDALDKAVHARFDVALLDLHLPGISGIDVLAKLKEQQPELEALMLTAHSSIETAVEAMRRGAYDYLTKPFRAADLEVHIQKAFEKVQLQRREQQWLRHLSYESPRYRLVGSSPAMRKVLGLIEKVAVTDSTVLVRGASGTGKELVARALHSNSPRRTRPLVTINCAALQETLLESELFGHEKGAFTGAVAAKPGLVEVAEGGTLFIDEIGEMAPGLQAKLLRVLEDGHYRRVGGTRETNADVRVVAAPLEKSQDFAASSAFQAGVARCRRTARTSRLEGYVPAEDSPLHQPEKRSKRRELAPSSRGCVLRVNARHFAASTVTAMMTGAVLSDPLRSSMVRIVSVCRG